MKIEYGEEAVNHLVKNFDLLQLDYLKANVEEAIERKKREVVDKAFGDKK